jgi:energy-converting hydrogenase B subunit Q
MAPRRSDGLWLAATRNSTDPLPCPFVAEVSVTHAAGLDAAHVQSRVVVISTRPAPPADGTGSDAPRRVTSHLFAEGAVSETEEVPQAADANPATAIAANERRRHDGQKGRERRRPAFGDRSRGEEPMRDRQANISYVDIIDHADRAAEIYLEFAVEAPLASIVDELRAVPGVAHVEPTPSFAKLYGKRIIIMGGGAQVGQVALGAISEADRHNIRGERISVDTIPLVGEENLASAVRAVVRLPRVRLLVLAGSLMGGDIARAVEEVRAKGLVVISLNQAGSVPDVADLVVSDPVQAGVMAVMAVAETARFDIVRQQKRRY